MARNKVVDFAKERIPNDENSFIIWDSPVGIDNVYCFVGAYSPGIGSISNA